MRECLQKKREREKEREGGIYKVTHQPHNQDHKSQRLFLCEQAAQSLLYKSMNQKQHVQIVSL